MQDNHQLDYQASSTATSPQGNGFYRLSWLQRIGFGAGDLAQNLIYQTICMYLLFFYTDVYVLGGDAAKAAGLAGTMFLVVRIVDVLWGQKPSGSFQTSYSETRPWKCVTSAIT